MKNTNSAQHLFDWSLYSSTSKYNDRLMLSKTDLNIGTKIFCKESYAQELYDLYSGYDNGAAITAKDFIEGQICTVIAKSIDFDEKVIIADEKYSKSTIFVPFREFSEEPSLLMHNDELREFRVMITKADDGDYYGSEKKCAVLAYRDNLNDFMKTDKWFYVKVVSLVKGGYLALYKGTVKCFLPGSHAAANVIRDFNEYLNTEIPVMIENFDAANDLYIVSYKKYIKHTLPQKVYDLEFGKAYTGVLTNNPYDFGIFVEFQNYYTGLIHKTEFQNYAEYCKDKKSGDKLEVFIKDITIKKGEPRIVLTDSLDKVDPDKILWQHLKSRVEGQLLNFTLDKEDFNVEIQLPDSDQVFRSDVSHLKGRIRIPNEGVVRISRVDIIRKNLKLDFINA
jgi:predicted RNA-binding protein with RPS1 domain